MSNHLPTRDYFEQIVENVQQGIVVYGRDHRYQFWNPFMEWISGVPAGEVLGRHPLEVFPFLEEFGIDRFIDRALAGETVTAPDLAYDLPATGKKGWVAAQFGPLRDARGEITGVLGVVSEVTERKGSEEGLQRSNRMLDALSRAQTRFFTGGDPRAMFGDMLSTLLEVTESAYGFLGEVLHTPQGAPYFKAHALSDVAWDEATRNFYREHAPDGLEFFNLETLFGAAMTTGQPVVANDAASDPRAGGLPPGHPALRSFLGLPIHRGTELIGLAGVANRPGGYDEGLIHFLTPFLRTCASLIVGLRKERADSVAEEAVRSSRRILEIVLNNIPQGVFWKDRASRYLGCNRVVAQAFGFEDPGQIVGKRDADFPGLTAEQAAFFVRKDREVMESDTPQHGIVEPATLPDGTTIWLETSKVPIHDADGQVVGVLGTWQDVTARRQLEEQLRQSQKMEAVGQLAGGVAHDFNNLLTVINGYSDILLSAAPPDDPLRELVAAIRDAGETASSLTRQLLAFSRKQILKPQMVDLNDVVSDTEKLLRRLIGEDVTLTVILDDHLGPVRVDPGMIEQVLMNLAVNARDAMPQGGRLTIETRNVALGEGRLPFPEARRGPYVELVVSDTGCGMTEEVKARIFEPFFTTKEPGKGTGLGLATAYGILKQSEGHIDVDSAPGRGTTFTLYLPAVEESVLAGQGGEGSGILPGGGETVLLVEDEAEVRKIARVALENHGYRVLEARDGIEGKQIAAANAGAIHLLITDVVMPGGVSGRELAEALRREDAGLKVLYVSGYTDDAVLRHGVSEALDPFLQKPFTPRVLAKKVRKVLDGQE